MKKFVLINGLSLVMLGIISSYGSKKVVAQNSARDILPLQLEEQIPVPSVAGRIDHFSADAKRKRLFVSALGNNSLEVIDVFAGRVVHSIKGLAQPQAPLYVPAGDKLYVANAEDGKVRVYDGLGRILDALRFCTRRQLVRRSPQSTDKPARAPPTKE